MIVRRLLVTLLAVLLAAQVVRTAAVAQLADIAPDRAAELWAGHPSVVVSGAMIEIARSARDRQTIAPAVLGSAYRAAQHIPLAAEPFLIRGVQAQLAGDAGMAQRAFAAAQFREPRSTPAAYFLAEHYLRTGDAVHGLRQLGVLARLSPNGNTAVAPYIAAYARDRSNWPALRRLFRLNPELHVAALIKLAESPANADAVLALASAGQDAATSRWLPVLVDSLVGAGQYEQARRIWAKASGAKVPPGTLLYDSGLNESGPPPPFNWSLNSSTVGLAERQPGGRLHVLFYGDDDGVLARQLLLLPAGAYRFSMQVAGDAAHARALSWSVRCDKAKEAFASVTLDAAARGWIFRVPAGCSAQWLELSGRSGDMPQQSDITISALRLQGTPGA